MKKKLLAVLLSMVFVLSFASCGGPDVSEEFSAFDEAIDTEYSLGITEHLGSLGDDPALGMRSAGSPAEHEASDYLVRQLKKAGFKNVTKDAATVDGWTFRGANITYTNAKGEESKIDLGGYQTTLKADNEEVELVYLGEGTEADYEGVDVKDKLVLIDIDQMNNWWINYPAKQAQLKGAKAVIAMSIFDKKKKDRIGSQDICGPADAPAFGISQKDSTALQKAIKKSGEDKITVTLNSDTKITPDATSYNVWGEIPGKTDDVVYMLAHYDGYYHSTYDNAHGVGCVMGITKALMESGYEPNKTIRVVFHGSEEFGKSGNEYDWSTGAYEQIMTNHPEWVDNAFAIVNIDGGYPVEGETGMSIRCSTELAAFAKNSAGELGEDLVYKWETTSPASTYTEDFMWTRMGIPSIVAGDGIDGTYDAVAYHSNYDSFEKTPMNEEGFLENHRVYGKIVMDLDQSYARPMDFAKRFKNIKKSLPEGYTEMDELLTEAHGLSEKIATRIEEVNANADPQEAMAFNEKTQDIYKNIQDEFLGIDYALEVINRHEMYMTNISYLDETISALEKGKIKKAYDDYLWGVDWAWYSMFFDEETCQYFIDQLWNNKEGTWGDGLIDHRQCDIDGVVRSLGEKYDTKNADVSSEIEELKALRETQEEYMQSALEKEKKGLEEIVDMMKEYLQ